MQVETIPLRSRPTPEGVRRGAAESGQGAGDHGYLL